jgi:hypothetical protein
MENASEMPAAQKTKKIYRCACIATVCMVVAIATLPAICQADGEIPLSDSETGFYSEFSRLAQKQEESVEEVVPVEVGSGGSSGGGAAGANAISPSSAVVTTAETPPSTTIAQARGERLSIAIGHYARARSLLIAAIREFDRGMGKADASPLLDVEEWRGNLITRAQELEKVLDPQPRSSRAGVKYEADPRLLGEPIP